MSILGPSRNFYCLQAEGLKKFILKHDNYNDWALNKINETINYAKNYSPFYKNNICVKEIEDLSRLSELPFTTRDDIKNNYPFGFLAAGIDKVVRYAESTGTTGKTSSGFVTAEEWIENNLTLYFGWQQILNKSDTLIIAVPYSLSYVGADIDRVSEMAGAVTIAAGAQSGVCDWERVLKLMNTLNVTAIVCAPTRILRLAYMAKEMGMDLTKNFNLKKIFCVGEALHDQKRKTIEQLWGCDVYVTYGMTEATSVGSPCKNKMIHLCENRYYFEIIDVDSGKPVNGNKKGELVLTSLANKAMPLIRFRTGDMVCIDDTHDNCYLPFKKIKHHGRIDDYIFLNDKKIFYHEIENYLLSLGELEPFFKFFYSDKKIHLYIVPKNEFEFHKIVSKIQNTFNLQFGFIPEIFKLNKKILLTQLDAELKPGTVLFQKMELN